MRFSTIFALIAAVAPFAKADCCYSDDLDTCRDGSDADPCCGRGACDVFCCNCYDGCIQDTDVKRRDAAMMNTADIFKRANTDGSGRLTLRQLAEFHGVADDNQGVAKMFHDADKNGDGVITIDEVAH